MRYCFDIDGTIFTTPLDLDGKPNYNNSQPIPFMRDRVNALYEQGHYIIFFTARGKSTGIDWTDITANQLKRWNFKYHELFPMFCKPTADIFVDDKGINVNEWIKTQPIKKGIIAGAFDLIHPGYIRMFKHAKSHCNHLTVALHNDPTTERSNKLRPIHSLAERIEILQSVKYIDHIFSYNIEIEFLSALQDYNVRFLGTDYSDGSYTGKDSPIEIVWIDRNHTYSTTALKKKIFSEFSNKHT